MTLPQHPTLWTLLLSSVTAAFRAKRAPELLALVFRVMLSSAKMFPPKAVVEPSVAELPTCQNALQAVAPPKKRTREPLAVVSVLPIWKTQTAPAGPLSLSVPVN